ncbi:DUF5753 domain-containing protein [Uniformispora flossi]|uniref:DUF5753 domain-containing protein n=1 Tax=Uniformispora flossi TaxID=3390723 RepID=UPI003C2C1E87
MATDSQHTLKRKRLGLELRRLREERGVTRNAAAAAIRGDVSKISRMELARAYVSRRDLLVLCRLYGLPQQQQAELEQLLVDKRPRHWWREYTDVMNASLADFVALEDDAAVEREYQPMTIPGLLQVLAYTTAVMETGLRPLAADQIGSLVALRQGRGRRLFDDPVLEFHGIVSEAALHVDTGGPAVMREQMLHLVEMAKLPNVTFQVVPFQGARRPSGTGFVTLGFTDPDDLDVAFIESIGGMIPRDTKREVRLYRRLFEWISTGALTPDDTVALLLDRAESLQ